jgi:hypothetical protein
MEAMLRNRPCYCGSGKKYKRCHGFEVSKVAATEGIRSFPFTYQPFLPQGVSPVAANLMRTLSRL